MTNILLQIAKIAEKENISIGALERSIGASKGVLSRAIAHNTDIQAKWIQKIIENYPAYNPEWIFNDKVSMLRDNKIEENPKKTSETPVESIDKNSIGIVLDRYEALAIENSNQKKEIIDLKNQLQNSKITPAYKLPGEGEPLQCVADESPNK